MKIVNLRDLEKSRIAQLNEFGLDEKSIKKTQDSIKKRTENQSDELGKQLYDAIVEQKNTFSSKMDDVYNLAKRLIQRGANVNYREPEKGNFPLFICAMKGYVELAKLLIQAGADVNLQTYYGSTALMKAARHGHINILEMLLLMGADVNIACKDGDTALFSAKMHNQDRSAQLLLKHQACIRHMNVEGKTLKDINGRVSCLEPLMHDDEEPVNEPDVVDKAQTLLEEAKTDLRRFGIDYSDIGTWLEERSSITESDKDVVEKLPGGGNLIKPTPEQLRRLYQMKKEYNTNGTNSGPTRKHTNNI